MPYQHDDEWLDYIRQQRAAQIRRLYRQRIRLNRLKGGTDHDRRRTITPTQLEHGHDSTAYELAMYDANQDKLAQQESASGPASMPTVSDPAVQDYERNLYHRLGLTPPDETDGSTGGQSESSDPVIPDLSPAERIPDIDLFGILPIASGEGPAETDVWHENTPLTPGQEMEVDYLLSFVTDTLARDALITMKRDGIPPRSQRDEFMSPHAEWSWDATSDALALEMIDLVEESEMDEWLGRADSAPVETTARDLGNDWIERLVIIDAKSEDILLNKTGVVRADGSQYVGLQDTEVEALRELELELIFIHNHPNGTEASDEDLKSAFDAGAELLIVITPQGQEYVYIRGRYGMVEVRDEKASYEIGPATLDEALYLLAESRAQARVYLDDPPEFMFRQEGPGQPESEIYVPIGLTSEQAAEMLNSALTANIGSGFMLSISDWDASWVDNPAEWPEYEKLSELLDSTIIDVARRWNHPALGMSDDEVAALLLAHLRQEGHYRSGDGYGNTAKNWFSRTFLEGDPSVGPANLRPTVADQMAGQNPYIPMPPRYANLEFDDMGLLDDLQREWPNLDADQREALLNDDETAILLTAANVYRGVERLFVLYLYDEFGLKPEENLQDYLKEHGLQRDDLIERYLQQEEYRASVFNMLAWLSQGIPESDTLRSGSSGAAEVARWHASGGVRTVNAIFVSGAFDLEMDADGVRLFNDDEIYAYRYR